MEESGPDLGVENRRSINSGTAAGRTHAGFAARIAIRARSAGIRSSGPFTPNCLRVSASALAVAPRSRPPKLKNTTLTLSLKAVMSLMSFVEMLPPAENADVRECVEMRQRDGTCLHAAHRKAGHGAMRLIGNRPVVAVDVRNGVVNQHVLERAEIEVGEPATATGTARTARTARTAGTAGRSGATGSGCRGCAPGPGPAPPGPAPPGPAPPGPVPGRGPRPPAGMPPPFSITMMNGLALPSAIKLSMIKPAWPWLPQPVSFSPAPCCK